MYNVEISMSYNHMFVIDFYMPLLTYMYPEAACEHSRFMPPPIVFERKICLLFFISRFQAIKISTYFIQLA